jgi:hypothetical protein
MPVANKRTCEKCNKEYLQGDLLRDHKAICDDCRGIKKKKSKYELEKELENTDEYRAGFVEGLKSGGVEVNVWTSCPKCDYPNPDYKGLYTPGDTCGKCGYLDVKAFGKRNAIKFLKSQR